MDAVGMIGIGVNAVLLVLAVLEELQGNLIEQSIGQHVLVLLQVACGDLCAELIQLGSEIVSGAIRDGSLVELRASTNLAAKVFALPFSIMNEV